MNQNEKAVQFASLHKKGAPLILYNVWDAGSAKAVAEAGSHAIATSSRALAGSQGYEDGEQVPFDLFLRIISRIAAAIDRPVSVDFEGGFAGSDNSTLASNFGQVLDTGVVGVNFEDQVVKSDGLYTIDEQAARIRAIRAVADKRGVPAFINARTDLFLGPTGEGGAAVKEAIDRAKAYAAAGASGFFVPGLKDPALISQVVQQSPIPVNVLVMDGTPSLHELTVIEVARISYGAMPYSKVAEFLTGQASDAIYGSGLVGA